MTKISPEPWKLVEENSRCATADFCVVDVNEHCVITTVCSDCLGEEQSIRNADLKRIVACVNACRGISTENLEKSVQHENIVILGACEVLREAMERAVDVEIICAEDPDNAQS